MSTIAIYGAGPALGMATARRFGREGFRVALVARNRERLDGMVRELGGEGVEAAAFPADLNDRGVALAALTEIESRLGAIDVLAYNPSADYRLIRTAPPLSVATVEALLDPFLLTPLALVERVLPPMVERGDGGLLFALGGSARYPTPRMAGAGMVAAGLRNYALALHSDLRPKGGYAGALVIGVLIEGSEAHRNAGAWGGVPVVPAGDLAERLWDLYATRDRPEDEVVPQVSGAADPG